MSETITEEPIEQEQAEPEAPLHLSQRRSESELLAAASGAFDTITATEGEGEGETVPPPAQTTETAAARAVAVEQSRAASEPRVAADEPVEASESEAEAEGELPPPAPVGWLAEEPDFEAEARAELDLGETTPGETDPEGYGYEDDPRLQEERVKRLAAEKRLAHVESLRVKDARKGWAAEALEHAPLAVHEFGPNLGGIEASSKREFLRKAAAGHNKVREIAAAISPQVKQEVEQAVAEAKADAKAAYGLSTAGPGAVPARAGEAAAKVAAARESKGLRGAIRARLDNGLDL